MLYGFSTNITPLKSVNKDWSSAWLLIQQPNIKLTTKNTATGRWIVLSTSARNKYRRCRMKYHSLNCHAAAIIQKPGKRKEP